MSGINSTPFVVVDPEWLEAKLLVARAALAVLEDEKNLRQRAVAAEVLAECAGALRFDDQPVVSLMIDEGV
ncbi:MAG TPA: hypothetical protein VNE42_00150 [Acidimicrobiales bacterium]|nr:hypothetical protein [Acidimicrobiales bacterium]